MIRFAPPVRVYSSRDDIDSKSIVIVYCVNSTRGQSWSGETFCPTRPCQPVPEYRMDVRFSIPIAVAVVCSTLWTFCAAAEPTIAADTIRVSHSRVAMSALRLVAIMPQ